MENSIKIYAVISLIVIASCAKKNDNIHLEYFVYNDTLRVNEYYEENGELKKITSLSQDSTKHGFFETYYKNGKIRRKSNYLNGKLHGFDSIFYESGNAQIFQEWDEGFLILHKYVYFDSKEPVLAEKDGDTIIIELPKIKSYILFNSSSEVGFQVDYDETGNVIGVDGNTIVSAFFDTLNHAQYFILAKPPFFSGIVEVYEMNSALNKYELKNKNTQHRSNFEIKFHKDIISDYRYKLKYYIKNNESSINFIDRVEVLHKKNNYIQIIRHDLEILEQVAL